MCEICDERAKVASFSVGDEVKVYLVSETGESLFESNGILVEKAKSWYKPEPYADFVCPQSVTEANRLAGKEEGTFVMAIKEKWMVKMLDLPNQPILPRWLPRYHSTGVAHVLDSLDEDTYDIDIVLIDGEKYRVDYTNFCNIDKQIEEGVVVKIKDNYVSFDSLKNIDDSNYDILQATCKNLGKTFSRGDYVSFDSGKMVIDSLRYKSGTIYAYGRSTRVRKVELCELEHILNEIPSDSFDLEIF